MTELELVFKPFKSKKDKDRHNTTFGNNCQILGYGGRQIWYFKCHCGNISKTKSSEIDKGQNGCKECGSKWRYNKSLEKILGKTYNNLKIISVYPGCFLKIP